jgi:hypothetical protein
MKRKRAREKERERDRKRKSEIEREGSNEMKKYFTYVVKLKGRTK